MAALVSVWKLGPRANCVNDRGELLPVETASKPIINALGAFILWYGWFAFNVASPIAFSKGIGDAIGTTALVTAISPITASCSALLVMYMGLAPLSYESLLSCLLAGLVAITGACHTCNVWEAALIGFLSPAVFFFFSHMVRTKWKFDDPLQVIAIHLFCGIYSCFMEGVVANDVYGSPGLMHGAARHFGIQCLGIVVIVTFNFLVCCFLWDVVMKLGFFRNTEIRVSILDTYLGTRLFDLNYEVAMSEVLKCDSNLGRRMLYQFHQYVENRYANEQLDYLLVVNIFNDYMQIDFDNPQKIAQYALRIIDTYIEPDAVMCVNVSGTQRSRLLKIKRQLLFELKQYEVVDDRKNADGTRKNSKDNINVIIDTDIVPDLMDTGGAISDPDDNDKNKKKQKQIDSVQNTPVQSTPVRRHSRQFTRSTSLIKYDPSTTHGIDIRNENIFSHSYEEVRRILLPLFTHYLSSFKEKDEKRFNAQIPFKLQEDWMIEWSERLKKEKNVTRLGDTVPQHNDEGPLLKRLSNNDVELVKSQIGSSIQQSIQQVQKSKKSDFAVMFKGEETQYSDKKMIVVIE
eukprot:527896_1